MYASLPYRFFFTFSQSRVLRKRERQKEQEHEARGSPGQEHQAGAACVCEDDKVFTLFR